MLEYRNDIKETSYSRNIMPDSFSKSFPFYPETVGYFDASDKYYAKRSGLKNYLLFITVEGKGELSQNGQSCFLTPGSALLIDCNPYQEYRTVKGEGWKFFFLHFSAAQMDGYQSLLLKKLTPITLRSPDTACRLIGKIYKQPLVPSAQNAAAQSNLISALLFELTNSLDTSDKIKRQRDEITRLADFIRANSEKDLHLEDFMQLTHLSKHHLIRTFEGQTGLSPYKYLHFCRIEKALSLLPDTQKSIAQIAFEVGYNDPVVFIRHFKFFHKMPPGQYRGTYILLP